MKSQLDMLHERIAEVCRTTKPSSRQRGIALAEIKWALQSPEGLFAGLDSSLRCVLVQPEHAMFFDGRDNEELKRRFYETSLKVKLSLVLVDQAHDGHSRQMAGVQHAN